MTLAFCWAHWRRRFYEIARSGPAPIASEALASASKAEEMAKYGITRVPVDDFHYRQFRYTNLEDAIPQAKRDQQRMD